MKENGYSLHDKKLKGRIQGGRTRRAPPLKLVKIWFFWRKIVIFHMKYPKNFARPPKIGKIWFFGVKSWFFTGNTPTIFAPPSARRNFFKCAPPLSLKSWIRPWLVLWDRSRNGRHLINYRHCLRSLPNRH